MSETLPLAHSPDCTRPVEAPAGLHSARRGAYRVIGEVDEGERAVIVLRNDDRSRAYRR